jgi:adenosylhomocysteine nucleosidase
MRTCLVVAAESREFSGILKRTNTVRKLAWPGALYAREIVWNKDRWLLIANGPGTRLVLQALEGAQALEVKRDVDQVLSIGFCGALDPALRVGDVVDSRGLLTTVDRVAITAAEKRRLYQLTGAAAVEMECAAVEVKALEWGVPFHCVKAVSDLASEDLPLDFNKYRDREGRFSRTRIACAALGRPFSAIPGLMRLDRNCRFAADRLGEFLADSVF